MMGICALVGIVVPVLLAIWLIKKYNVNPVTIIIGAGVFIVFALLLESLMHQIVLKGPAGTTIMGNTLYYALYGGLAAGVFEETGRFVAMKWLLRGRASKALTGIAYGLGHGGIEMLLLFGVSMLSNMVISIMMNGGHLDLLLAGVPDDAKGLAYAQFEQLGSMTTGTLLIRSHPAGGTVTPRLEGRSRRRSLGPPLPARDSGSRPGRCHRRGRFPIRRNARG